MKKVATTREMQKIDSLAISSYGIEGLELMENAGIGIAKALKKRFYDFSKKEVLIFCGKGNNGGDGLVVARLLFNMKINVEVLLLKKKVEIKNNTEINAELAFKLGVKITELDKTNLHLLDDHLKN